MEAYLQLTKFDYLNLHTNCTHSYTPFVLYRPEYEPLVNKIGCTTTFMMREDSMRFAQLVHELQPGIRAFQFTQFMCSAWVKPVCTHTMGYGHKTVNTSPIFDWPVSVEVILFQRMHFSSIPLVFYLSFPLNCWMNEVSLFLEESDSIM